MTTLNKKLSVTTLAMALMSTGVLATGFDRLPGSESPQMRRFREAQVPSYKASVFKSITEDDLKYTEQSDSPRRERHSAQAEKARVSAEPGILGKIGQLVVSFIKSFFAR